MCPLRKIKCVAMNRFLKWKCAILIEVMQTCAGQIYMYLLKKDPY